MLQRKPTHKSKAVTFIPPAVREAAVREQNKVLQGKGMMKKPLPKTPKKSSYDSISTPECSE